MIFRYAWMDAGSNFGFFISFPGEELPFATPHSLTYSLTPTHLQTHIGLTHSSITPIKPNTEPTIHLSFSFPTLAFCGCPWGSLNHTSRTHVRWRSSPSSYCWSWPLLPSPHQTGQVTAEGSLTLFNLPTCDDWIRILSVFDRRWIYSLALMFESFSLITSHCFWTFSSP